MNNLRLFSKDFNQVSGKKAARLALTVFMLTPVVIILFLALVSFLNDGRLTEIFWGQFWLFGIGFGMVAGTVLGMIVGTCYQIYVLIRGR